ncbi:MAG: YqaE/Pmp3 family membrane protein [Chloroflexi bacterium]|nr:YqaE/Pmp3 family membrane protein [Chloroflexota bacterium]
MLDRGCGTILLVFLLTLAGWVPGVIAALLRNYVVVANRQTQRAVRKAG